MFGNSINKIFTNVEEYLSNSLVDTELVLRKGEDGSEFIDEFVGNPDCSDTIETGSELNHESTTVVVAVVDLQPYFKKIIIIAVYLEIIYTYYSS